MIFVHFLNFYLTFSGALKLVEHLHKHGVPIAMATSSSQDSVDMKMQNYKELLVLFDHITMGHTDPEVKRGKPDPIIFQVCASRFRDKPNPENVSYNYPLNDPSLLTGCACC